MTCPQCGCVFCPHAPAGVPQVYCSPQCKRAAKAKRVRQRELLAACAENDKRAWLSEHGASLAAARFESQFGTHFYPYECACGYWHLTKVHPDAPKRAAHIKLILFGAKS